MKLTKAEKQAKWVATPVAWIEKPLRFIAAKTNGKNEKGETVVSNQFKLAFMAAYNGDGAKVQRIARGVLNG